MPPGTISVMWNDDPLLEWNYDIPLHEDGTPFSREEMLDHLTALMYDQMEEREKRKTATFPQRTFKLDEEIDLTDRGESYRVAREELANAPGPEPTR